MRAKEVAGTWGRLSHIWTAQHRKLSRQSMPYLFSSGALALVLVVSLYPILYAFTLSLHDTDYMVMGKFVGLKNFLRAASDARVYNAVGASLVYTLGSLVLVVPIGLMLALILNQPIRFCALFRTILIFPWIVSQTVTALLWSWLLNPNFGPVNYLFAAMGLSKIMFVANPDVAMTTLIAINVWQSYPYAMVLFLAALQTIPNELYEAARIDGASAGKCFRYVTIPIISNVLMVVVIMCTLHYFNMVTLMYVLTGGGPIHTTETLSLKVFLEAFTHWDMSLASTLGIVIFAFNAAFSVLYIRLLRRESLY